MLYSSYVTILAYIISSGFIKILNFRLYNVRMRQMFSLFSAIGSDYTMISGNKIVRLLHIIVQAGHCKP